MVEIGDTLRGRQLPGLMTELYLIFGFNLSTTLSACSIDITPQSLRTHS